MTALPSQIGLRSAIGASGAVAVRAELERRTWTDRSLAETEPRQQCEYREGVQVRSSKHRARTGFDPSWPQRFDTLAARKVAQVAPAEDRQAPELGNGRACSSGTQL